MEVKCGGNGGEIRINDEIARVEFQVDDDENDGFEVNIMKKIETLGYPMSFRAWK